MYEDSMQQQLPPLKNQQLVDNMQRSSPMHPQPMMHQPSASSTSIINPDHQPSSAPPNHFGSHVDGFGGKRKESIHKELFKFLLLLLLLLLLSMFQMLPPIAYSDNPSTSFAVKFVHSSLNKNRCSINFVVWTPSRRRLITGSQSGEFTLWNGQSFNFEMILQFFVIIRIICLLFITYWQSNMNNLKANRTAHKEFTRGICLCKTDLKLCSCYDDTIVKSVGFCQADHGWDVKCVDWHPTKSLLVSGEKYQLVKMLYSRTARELCSLHAHKNMVLYVKWNQNGNWLLTASKDQIIKLYDIRTMKELESFRGHKKDVTSLVWHPIHEEYFVSGSADGSICHWNSCCGSFNYLLNICQFIVSNDYTTKFWSRNRPADNPRDLFIMLNQGYNEQGFANRLPDNFHPSEASPTPGAFVPGLTQNEGTILGIGIAMPFDAFSQGEHNQPHRGSKTPPLSPGPHPSLIRSNQQQGYQHHHHHQGLPQQIHPMPNMPHLQPPQSSLIPLHPHPHHPALRKCLLIGGMNPQMSQSHYMDAPSVAFQGPPSGGGPHPMQQQPPLPTGPPPNTNQQHQ
ncbi:hypothetical protein N665_0096s0009 [Sinapis alba]|nr:hypothetical protein N665_0096s0009 [Sinapis alba]